MPNKYNIQAQRQELDRLVRERAWNSFRTLFKELASNKENCRSIVESRNRHTCHRTLLHSICVLENNQPPSDVVGLIASISLRAVFTPDLNQMLPLHIAIRRGAGIETIKVLLDSVTDDCEDYSKDKMLLHTDSTGSTPLLLAVKMDSSDNREEIIRYLVNQDATGLSLLSSNSRKKKQQKLISPLKYVAARDALFVDDGLDSPQGLLRFMIVSTYRAKMKELVADIYNIDAYTYKNIEDNTEVCLLQAAIICHDIFGSVKLASSILSAIIRNGLFRPNHIDSAGNSTLHIACLSSANKFEHILKLGQRETNYGINSDDCTLMEHVIKCNMHSFTNFCQKNSAGDIPLHCAIRTRKDILHIQQLLGALEQSARICTREGELPIHLALKSSSTEDVVMEIWRAYPDAALVMDRSTCLYLFQLAATFGAGTGDHIRNNTAHATKKDKKQDSRMHLSKTEELEHLSLSYLFLRERPEVISFFH